MAAQCVFAFVGDSNAGEMIFVILCRISDCPCMYGSGSVCVIVLSAFGAAFGCAGAGGFVYLAT